MDSKLVQSISQEVFRRFPDLHGRSPRVQSCRPGTVRSGLRMTARPATYLLVYSGKKTTSTGKILPYAVRVIADGRGKILKITLTH